MTEGTNAGGALRSLRLCDERDRSTGVPADRRDRRDRRNQEPDPELSPRSGSAGSLDRRGALLRCFIFAKALT
jgi:hypothetical protein